LGFAVKARPASAAVTVWRRRTIDDVLTDGEERLLEHISQ
jgi:hypothetical protein